MQPQYYQPQQPGVQPYPQQYAQPAPAQPMMTPQMMNFLAMLLIAFGVIFAGIGTIVSYWLHGIGWILAGVGVLLLALQKSKMI